MGRGPLIAFVGVLLVAALSAGAFLTKKREVIASTPSAYTGLTVPLPLPAGSQACANEILFDANSEIARFGATAAAGTAAPALEVTARGYSDGVFHSDYRSTARVPGGYQGTKQLDAPLTPPRREVFGELCVRNLGDQPIDLVGSQDGRAYSRPSVRVDGVSTPIELQLRLMETGRHSLLSRAGQTTEHAATLKPFGAWWFWLLALALVTVTPLALLAAVRTALDGDAAQGLDQDTGRTALPVERLRRELARVPGWAIVAAVAALAVLWLSYWSLSTHVFQNDEDQYVYLSRWLQTDFPSSLWNFDAYGRGLQRLEVWLLAIPAALFDAPWSLRGGRILNTIAFVSAAIPIYLLGRRLSLRPQWAALPAVVSILVPWAVVTTGFLTENVAYPMCFWVIWAIWRTTTDPSPGRDLLALVLLIVAGAARSGLLILVPVLPLVVAGTGLRCNAGPLLTRTRTVLREHLVLWVAVAGAALFLLAGALGIDAAGGVTRRLAGGYATDTAFDLSTLLTRWGAYLSKVVVGTGFFAAAVGLPWVAIQLVRSRDPGRFAFALLVVISALALLYSLNTAGPDERYVMYLAPLILLPATLAIAKREVSPVGLGVASVLLAILLIRVPWETDLGPFGYFVRPAEMFYTHAVGLRLAKYLPGDYHDALVFAGIALGLAGVVLAVILRRSPGRLAGVTAVVLIGAVVAIIPIQTQYTLSKYVNGAGSKAAPGLRARAFADTLVPHGQRVAEFAEGAGQQPAFFPLWQEVQFYNQRIDRVFALGVNRNPIPPGDELVSGVSWDPRTGRLRSSVPLPPYLVIPTPVGVARVRGEVVSAPSYLPVALVRLAQPPTLDWSASGFGPQGALPAAGAELRFYGTGQPPGESRCAAITYLASPAGAGRWRMEIDGDVVSAGVVAAGGRRDVTVPLWRLAERGFIDARIRGNVSVAGVTVVDGC